MMDNPGINSSPRLERAISLAQRLVAEALVPLKRSFVGKDEIVDLMGVSLVAGENLFLLGPPGTAKSALVHELSRRMTGGHTFEYLLTRFTEPNELFGPFDIRKLRDGELITNTEGMLPEASLVFLDELLNANSAILNALLGVLNERVFRRGRETRRLPLLMAVGASNRLPEEDALAALFDRFLLRVRCDNVPTEHLGDVLSAGWALDSARQGESDAGPRVDVDHVREINAALRDVDLGPVRPTVVDLVRRLRTAGLPVSDRRAVKLQRLVAASALLSGRGAALTSDVWVFRYIWDTVEQQEVLASVVQEVIERCEVQQAEHPRARGDAAPDPEQLAADLRSIAEAPPDDTAATDRLSILAARVPWVRNDLQREELQKQVDALWLRRRIGESGT